MSPRLALIVCVLFILWLFITDRKRTGRISRALWVPLVWITLLGSKPVSLWLSGQAQSSDSEGSPLDRLIRLGLVVTGVVILTKRKVSWQKIIANNKWFFLYFFYIGSSMIWSDNPLGSLKEWVKDIGNIIMVVIVLSEENPATAVKTLLLRCSFLLIPLSTLLAKYYPDIGRGYDQWTYQPIILGATTDKNALGAMLYVCGIGLCWSFLDLRRQKAADKWITVAHLIMMAMTLWLLSKSHCATGLTCVILGAAILMGMRRPAIRSLIQRHGLFLFIAGPVLALSFHLVFNLGEVFVGVLGRDLTFTGRTEIWKRCLQIEINPLIGAGYCNFMTGERAEKLSEGYFYPLKEPHNGYLATYLDSGLTGLSLLLGVLAVGVKRINHAMADGSSFTELRLAFLVSIAVYNFTESSFNGLNLIWFALLLVLLEYPGRRKVTTTKLNESPGKKTEGLHTGRHPAGSPGSVAAAFEISRGGQGASWWRRCAEWYKILIMIPCATNDGALKGAGDRPANSALKDLAKELLSGGLANRVMREKKMYSVSCRELGQAGLILWSLVKKTVSRTNVILKSAHALAKGRRCQSQHSFILFMKIIFSLVAGVFVFTFVSSAASPLPLSRTPGGRGTWNGLVGVPGGIPSRTIIYQTFSPGATAAQINAALAACPSNQVVYLNAGTYNLTSQLLINRNGVTLRGAGPNSTIINASGSGILVGDSNWWNEFATPIAANHRNWTGNYTQGTTVITVDNAAGISVGNLIFLDQLNDPDTTAYSPANPDGPYVNGEYTSVAQPIRGYDRIQFQINRVKAVSGNTITLYEPVYMPNWAASRSPQVWFETTPRLTEMCGIENLAINTDGQDNNPINLQYTYACWVKNCSLSIGIGEHHGYVFPLMSIRPEVRECYIHDTGVHDRYGIHTRMVAGALVENNIFNGHTTMFMVNGVSGSVYAYNYATNIQQNTGYMVSGIYTHGGTPNMCLFEGNRSPQLGLDSQWQNSAYMVSFRNRHVGKDDRNLATGNIQAVGIFCTNRHASVIGCVLGKKGVNTVYQDDGTTSCHDGSRVFYLGLESGGSSCSGNFDPVVISTLVRAVNWTSATTTNGGIVLDGFTTSDLPNSLYLTAKPSFFGNLRWPAIDPALPDYSDSQTNIPAGYRFVFGVDPPGAGGPVNQAPIPVATASPKTGSTPLTVSFSSAGSIDPEGTSLTYNWTFGDGTTSTAANPSHIYLVPGSYTAFLTVSDGVNAASSTNLTITVTVVGVNLPPIALANAPLLNGAAPFSVSFSSAGSADPEGSPLTYNWTFGDGATSTAANPSHSYSASGIYTAQLRVSDGVNTSLPATVIITVGNGASGLVASYGFEEASGNLVSDTSGNGNNGTINGATRTSGRFGAGLSFDGTSSLVTINDSASLDMNTRMTLEAWVYPTANSGWKDVIYKNTDIYFLMGSTPQAQAPGFGGSFVTANAYGPAPLPANTWAHLAGTYDGTTMRLYVNGVQVASRAQTGAITTSAGQLSIGGDSSNNQFWAGLIDEVRIYNRALSAAEILADMNTPVIGNSTAPNPPNGLRIMLSP